MTFTINLESLLLAIALGVLAVALALIEGKHHNDKHK